MRATEEKVIDGNTYSISQLPGMTSYKLLNRLARVMAPGLSALPSGGMEKVGDMEVSDLARAVPQMLEQLPEEEQERITRLLLESCLVDGQPLLPKFNTHFMGRSFTVIKVVMFALQVNYGNFRDALAASGIGRGTAERSDSETSSTSAGPPNGSSKKELRPAET